MNEKTLLGHERRTIKTGKMLLLEQEHGKPIDELVIEAYNKYGFRGACDFLDVTSTTLSNWTKKLGITIFHGAAKKEKLEELGLSVQPVKKPEEE